jgi:MFS family permease
MSVLAGAVGEEYQLQPGEVAARIDRLPVTRVQWRLALITQWAWGLILATDGSAAVIYPFVWKKEHAFSQHDYTILYAMEVGAGILIGQWAMGYISDRIGRKKAILLSAFLASAFFWPMAFTNRWDLLMVFGILSTFGVGGILCTNAVYMDEVLSPGQRHQVGFGAQTLAIVALGLAASLIPYFWVPVHYRWYFYLLAFMPVGLVAPVVALWLPESPRWLEGKGRHADANRVLRKMEEDTARYAGPLPEPVVGENPIVVVEKVPVRDLFAGVYGRRLIVLLVAWILGYSGLVYGYGAFRSLTLVARGATAHLTFAIALALSLFSGSLGVVNYVLKMSQRVDPRYMIMFGGICNGVGILIVFATGSLAVTVIGLFIAGIGSRYWLYSMYIYTPACFPTRIRSVALGWTDGVGHLGSLAGPIFLGGLYAAVAGSFKNPGLYLYLAIPGAIIPGFIIGLLGPRQKEAVLEQLST